MECLCRVCYVVLYEVLVHNYLIGPDTEHLEIVTGMLSRMDFISVH